MNIIIKDQSLLNDMSVWQGVIARLPITIIGYGGDDVRRKIKPLIVNGTITDMRKLYQELDGRLSKKSTGRLMHYLCSNVNYTFSLE